MKIEQVESFERSLSTFVIIIHLENRITHIQNKIEKNIRASSNLLKNVGKLWVKKTYS